MVMNFSKAFDKVDHKHLTYKLFNLGIHIKTVKCITSFLQNRTRTVELEQGRIRISCKGEGGNFDRFSVLSNLKNGCCIQYISPL